MTPTTPHVAATDRTPPMFRPGNQARLEPAQPLNPSASQSMLPGLGAVRSGNGFNDNALHAKDGQEFAAMVNKRRAWAGQRQNIKQLKRKLAEVELQLQAPSATGQSLPSSKLRELQAAKRRLIAAIAAHGRTDNQPGAVDVAPWQRKKKVRTPKMVQHKSLPTVPGPKTPSALDYEPGAFSAQSGMRKLKAMQANVQPVVPMRQMAFAERAKSLGKPSAAPLDGWLEEETIPNVPNWALAAGGGGLILLLLLKKRRRSRKGA